MAKVTSKYQVTVPKVIAEKYNIHPGDEIHWLAAGEVIRVIPPGEQALRSNRESQLHLFDKATERHRRRRSTDPIQRPGHRGWRREDLYRRRRSH
jgi:AbrB family looped-hinge helix DNA binding protein